MTQCHFFDFMYIVKGGDNMPKETFLKLPEEKKG